MAARNNAWTSKDKIRIEGRDKLACYKKVRKYEALGYECMFPIQEVHNYGSKFSIKNHNNNAKTFRNHYKTESFKFMTVMKRVKEVGEAI
ncbi:hypothetical protein WKH56_20170 [Priestia sp. SB1]|uniref:hypothetical protein n=1 Tax=Priestia sp. SB1 TaxID=3132359 RepID=UPI00316E81BF